MLLSERDILLCFGKNCCWRLSLSRAGYKRNSNEDEMHKHVCIITFVQDTLLIKRFSATTCTNKTYIWVELQVVSILGKLIEVFEVHGLIDNTK